MRRFDNSPAGFTLTIVVFGLLVVLTLATAGWAIYRDNQVPVATSTTVKTPAHSFDPTAATTATITAQGLIKIPELGIQLTLPASLKDLTYSYNKTNNPWLDAYGSTENTAGVSTNSLAAIDNN